MGYGAVRWGWGEGVGAGWGGVGGVGVGGWWGGVGGVAWGWGGGGVWGGVRWPMGCQWGVRWLEGVGAPRGLEGVGGDVVGGSGGMGGGVENGGGVGYEGAGAGGGRKRAFDANQNPGPCPNKFRIFAGTKKTPAACCSGGRRLITCFEDL